MNKRLIACLAALVLVSTAGCWGPQKLTRHMDDWTNQTYVDNPWLAGNTVSAALLHGLFAVTGLLDAFINAYYFWAIDAEPLGAGSGTKFEHRPATPTRK